MLNRFTQGNISLLLQVFHLRPCRIPAGHHCDKAFVLLPELQHILRFVVSALDPENQLLIIHHIRHLSKTPQTQGENAQGAFINYTDGLFSQ